MICNDLESCSTTPNLIKDYLNQKDTLKSLYRLFPSKENLLEQAKIKTENYTYRNELVFYLNKQFKNFKLSKKQVLNLKKLSGRKTITITTGHQLMLLTGSVFFHYKILHIIKLCDELNQEQDEFYFVPMFWLASEDHDFEEINHFYFQNKKYSWDENFSTFPVGRIPIDSLKTTLNEFTKDIYYLPNAKKIIESIEFSYFSSATLSEATQKLIYFWYASYGLLWVDADDVELKNLMNPYFLAEFEENCSYNKITETVEKLKNDYKIQVNPRENNLFYLNKNERVRVGEKQLNNNDLFPQTSTNQLSPNALLRPFYQEVILPNVAYIGGNAEISYWLELKNYFDYWNVPFPILIPRNSFTFYSGKQKLKLEKLQLNFFDLLNNKQNALNQLIINKSTISIDFYKLENQVKMIYENMILESEKTDKTLKNLLLAQQKRQLNAFETTKRRILKAEKRQQNDLVEQFNSLYSSLFPFGTLQERTINFSEFYIQNPDFFKLVYKNLNTLKPKFVFESLS